MAVIDRPLSQAAFCWWIERRDGGGVAATSHDNALEIDGIHYEPHPGITPFSAHFSSQIDAEDGEISGALVSSGMAQEDLELGRWDGASVRLTAVNWEDVAAGEIEFADGNLGELRSTDGSFEAALVGPKAKLERPVCLQTQPTCRAMFGDRECRVSLAGREQRWEIVSITGMDLKIDQPLNDDVRFGDLTFLDGENRGFRTTILSVAADVLTLRDIPRGHIVGGERVVIMHGCDKRFATCRDRFANHENFRSEPHLPGRDLLTRYPGA